MVLLDAYYDYVLKNTECPVTFHRWSIISAVAASLGRNFYLPFGHGVVYPNMMIKLIGQPATRKSSAIGIVKELLEQSGYLNIIQGGTSREKFLEDLSNNFSYLRDNTEEDGGELLDLFEGDSCLDSMKICEAFIAAGEFTNFMGQGNSSFASYLGDLYDNPSTYPIRLKNGKSLMIQNPIINILGGNT